jgi:hypothetical protein
MKPAKGMPGKAPAKGMPPAKGAGKMGKGAPAKGAPARGKQPPWMTGKA